jgi:RNA polymerase sigma-70 factor, ECF subfamily
VGEAAESIAPVEARPNAAEDRALARAAATGDRRARAALIDRLMDRIRRTASYMVSSRAEAEDLAQIALLEVLGSAGSFRGESSLDQWADRIVVRVISQHFRKRTRREGLFSRFFHPPSPTNTLEKEISLKEARGRITHHLDALTPDRRTAFVLHHVLDYSVEEISDLTDAPVNTVRGRLREGRKQLRKRALSDPTLREWALAGSEA